MPHTGTHLLTACERGLGGRVVWGRLDRHPDRLFGRQTALWPQGGALTRQGPRTTCWAGGPHRNTSWGGHQVWESCPPAVWWSRGRQDPAALEPVPVCGAEPVGQREAGPETGRRGQMAVLHTRGVLCPWDKPPSLPSDATKSCSFLTLVCNTLHTPHRCCRPQRPFHPDDPTAEVHLVTQPLRHNWRAPEHDIQSPENLGGRGPGVSATWPRASERAAAQVPASLPHLTPAPRGQQSLGVGRCRGSRALPLLCTTEQALSQNWDAPRRHSLKARGKVKVLSPPDLDGREAFTHLPAAWTQPAQLFPGGLGARPQQLALLLSRGGGGKAPSLSMCGMA